MRGGRASAAESPRDRGATCGGRALRLRRAPAPCNALQPRETRGPAIPCAPLQHRSDLCSLSSQVSLRCSLLPRTTRPSAQAANHRSARFHFEYSAHRSTREDRVKIACILQRPCARPCTSRLPSPLPCCSLKMSPRPSPCSLATKVMKNGMNPTRVLQP